MCDYEAIPGIHVEDLCGACGGRVHEALLRHLAGVHAVLPDHRHPEVEVAWKRVESSVDVTFSSQSNPFGLEEAFLRSYAVNETGQCCKCASYHTSVVTYSVPVLPQIMTLKDSSGIRQWKKSVRNLIRKSFKHYKSWKSSISLNTSASLASNFAVRWSSPVSCVRLQLLVFIIWLNTFLNKSVDNKLVSPFLATLYLYLWDLSENTDLSSSPFTPLGILVKSSIPLAFCTELKVQLSVPVKKSQNYCNWIHVRSRTEMSCKMGPM